MTVHAIYVSPNSQIKSQRIDISYATVMEFQVIAQAFAVCVERSLRKMPCFLNMPSTAIRQSRLRRLALIGLFTL